MLRDLVQQTLSDLQAGVNAGTLAKLHGVLVLRGGLPLMAAYFNGPDERMGWHIGEVAFGPEVPHDLRSVSKSVVGLLLGSVVTEHEIDLQTPLFDILVDRRAQFGAAARALTLQHVAGMTMGLAWDESLSYADPRNAERQMSDADDRVAFVLGKPATEPPGRHWHYCGGATELLAAVITQASGKSLEEFAAQRLFTPLGLRNIEWMGDTKGPYAASGLRMTLPDLARIGQLILKDGRWDGAELIPSAWLRVALSPYVNIANDLNYGYHFYCGTTQVTARTVHFSAGVGNGGQRLSVLPALDAVVVISCGNYNDFRASFEVPTRVMRDHVLPLLAAVA